MKIFTSKNFLLAVSFLTVFALSGFSQCNVIYVTPTGTAGGAGTKASPLDIVTAFNTAPTGTTVKLSTGTYTIDNPLTLANSGVTIEGGFLEGLGWQKSSAAGATTIFRTNLNQQGAGGQQRVVAIYVDSKSNFKFRDLTVSTANGTGSGTSTYGVHVKDCSDFYFTRTQVLPGNATAGANGTNGSAGATGTNGAPGTGGDIDDEGNPGEGGAGGNGAGTGFGGAGAGAVDPTGNDNCGCFPGLSGGPGSASINLRAGGGGGGGGGGGEPVGGLGGEFVCVRGFDGVDPA